MSSISPLHRASYGYDLYLARTNTTELESLRRDKSGALDLEYATEYLYRRLRYLKKQNGPTYHEAVPH